MPQTYEIKGIEALDRKIRGLLPLFERGAQRAVADTALFSEVEIADQIDAMGAVRTGRLKGSMSAKRAKQSDDSATRVLPGGLSAVVGTNVEYAIAVHDGYTRKLKGKTVKAAYGASRGRLTKRRIDLASKASKRQASLKISQGSYSRDEGGNLTLQVEGRPFMQEAVPAIERRFIASVEEQIGGIL